MMSVGNKEYQEFVLQVFESPDLSQLSWFGRDVAQLEDCTQLGALPALPAGAPCELSKTTRRGARSSNMLQPRRSVRGALSQLAGVSDPLDGLPSGVLSGRESRSSFSLAGSSTGFMASYSAVATPVSFGNLAMADFLVAGLEFRPRNFGGGDVDGGESTFASGPNALRRSGSISQIQNITLTDELEISDLADEVDFATLQKSISSNLRYSDFDFSEDKNCSVTSSILSSDGGSLQEGDNRHMFMFDDVELCIPERRRSMTPSGNASPSADAGRGDPAYSTNRTRDRAVSYRGAYPAVSQAQKVQRPDIIHGDLIRTVQLSFITGHSGAVRQVVIVDFLGDAIVSCGMNDRMCTMRLNLGSGFSPQSNLIGHRDVVNRICVSANQKMIATTSADKWLCIHDLNTMRHVAVLEHPSPVTAADFSRNNRYIVSGCKDGSCRLWASRKKDQHTSMSTFLGHRAGVTCISFQPLGDKVLSGCSGGAVMLWFPSTGKLDKMLITATGRTQIINVGFNWNGTVAFAVDAKSIHFFDPTSGSVLHRVDAQSCSVNHCVQQKLPGSLRTSLNKKNGEEKGNRSERKKQSATGAAVTATPHTSSMDLSCIRSQFTFATFAPQERFPNYFFMCCSTGFVILSELLFSAPRWGEGEEAGTHTRSPDPENPIGKAMKVELSPEIWNEKLKSPIRCGWCGKGTKTVMGDSVGNIILLDLIPRDPETAPPTKTFLNLNLGLS